MSGTPGLHVEAGTIEKFHFSIRPSGEHVMDESTNTPV